MNVEMEIFPEDRTFKILSRKSYHEMYSVITDKLISEFDTLSTNGALDLFLDQHGWTWEEFSEEHRKDMEKNYVNR